MGEFQDSSTDFQAIYQLPSGYVCYLLLQLNCSSSFIFVSEFEKFPGHVSFRMGDIITPAEHDQHFKVARRPRLERAAKSASWRGIAGRRPLSPAIARHTRDGRASAA